MRVYSPSPESDEGIGRPFIGTVLVVGRPKIHRLGSVRGASALSSSPQTTALVETSAAARNTPGRGAIKLPDFIQTVTGPSPDTTFTDRCDPAPPFLAAGTVIFMVASF